MALVICGPAYSGHYRQVDHMYIRMYVFICLHTYIVCMLMCTYVCLRTYGVCMLVHTYV